MRNDRNDNYRDSNNRNDINREPRWLHGHHHGQNTDRGNYTVDSHFNRGYGDNDYSQYGDSTSFNSNADHRQMSPQGRFQPGGARYSGEDFTHNSRNQDNPYGMNYIPDDDHNSGRHYDARADYSNGNYDDLRRQGPSNYRGGMADERFGHDVSRGGNRGNWMGHSSRGDYESYRRYEQGSGNYDNDYSTGFAGRNYTPGRSHYGEDSTYSNMENWQNRQDQDRNRRDRDRY